MSRKIFEIFKCWLNITRSEMLTDSRYSNRKPNNLKCLIHNARFDGRVCIFWVNVNIKMIKEVVSAASELGNYIWRIPYNVW